MPKLVLAIVILTLSFVSSPSIGLACMCEDSPATDAEVQELNARDYNEAQFVFVGTVVSISNSFDFTFEIEEVYKGEVSSRITLGADSSCAYDRFEVGAAYLVVGSSNEAWKCSFTGPLETRSPELLELLVELRDNEYYEVFPNTGSGGLAGSHSDLSVSDGMFQCRHGLD